MTKRKLKELQLNHRFIKTRHKNYYKCLKCKNIFSWNDYYKMYIILPIKFNNIELTCEEYIIKQLLE